jgi:hypothetical protein
MNSKYGAVSWGAIGTLGAIGPSARSAEKPLRAYVMKHPRALDVVNEALAQMDLPTMTEKDLGDTVWKPEKALDYLVDAPSGDYAQSTLEYLRQKGPDAAYAVPALIAFGKKMEVNDPYWMTKAELAGIFQAIGPAASPAVPLLESWLKDKSASFSAARALEAIRSQPSALK